MRQSNNSCQNDNHNDDNYSHYTNEEENHNDEQPPPPPPNDSSAAQKGSSSVDVDVIKSIQAQLASLTLRDELKKVGTICPYLLEWDSVPYSPKFKPPTLYSYDGKTLSNQHIYYFRS